MARLPHQALVLSWAVAAPTTPAFAQDPGGSARPARLALAMSLYGGIDDNALVDSAGARDEQLQSGRQFQGAQLSLGATRRRARWTLSADAVSAVRYYADLRNIATQRHGGAVRLAVRTSRQTVLNISQDFSYSPTYQFAVQSRTAIPDIATTSIDYGVVRQKQIIHGTGVAFQYAVGRGRTLSFDVSAREENFFSAPDFVTRRAGTLYTQQLARGFELRLGYAAGSMGLSGMPTVRQHDIDAGVSYRRAIALSQRTLLSFSSTSAVVATAEQRQFVLGGSARVQRLLSRDWAAEAVYERGVQLIDRLPRPFVADTITAALSGAIHRRWSLRVAPTYSRGADVVDASRTYSNWLNQTRATVSVSRHWSVYAEHLVFHYRFSNMPDLAAALGTRFDRQGIRFGLALAAPLVR
jgi:hypothetical protein